LELLLQANLKLDLVGSQLINHLTFFSFFSVFPQRMYTRWCMSQNIISQARKGTFIINLLKKVGIFLLISKEKELFCFYRW
jgi:hypothetical protein